MTSGDDPLPFARLDPVPPARTRQEEEAGVETTARGSGRPLDENVDQAILDAAWQLLLKDGYGRLSIARVAELARVGRPAIYRRYRDKSELVAAVIADKRSRVPRFDSGNAREELIAYLEFARRRFAVALAGTLLVDGRKHPDLLEQFRAGMLRPQLAELTATLERGKARGEIRADLNSELALHALMGAFMLHNLAVGPPKRGWAEELVDTLWQGFAAAPDPADDQRGAGGEL